MEHLRTDYKNGKRFYAEDMNHLTNTVNLLIDGKADKNHTHIAEQVTTKEIPISDGAPINAIGVWDDNVIPSGETIQSILEKLLLREIFPSAAITPSISLNGGTDMGLKELGSTVTIPAISMSKNTGRFDKDGNVDENADIIPSITWSNESITVSVSKFNNVTINTGTTRTPSVSATVELGTNKVTYSGSAIYTKPNNLPVTNLGNETQSTTQVVTGGTDVSAIWVASTATTNTTVTATGVHPCYTNVGNNTLNTNPTTKCSLTSGNIITVEKVPSENVAQKHFIFEYPSGRTCEFKIKDLEGNFVDYAATYTESASTTHSGYIRLETTGNYQGPNNTYRFILSKSLNS